MGRKFAKKFLFGIFWALFFVGCSEEASQDSIADFTTEGTTEVAVNFVGGPIMFTEIDPTNLVYEDHEGGDGSWVEIFNTSTEPVNLKGKYLTDSLKNPTKWTFGNVEVAPQSFMVVFLSGKNLADYVAPTDTTNLIGSGCWKWTDSENDPAGYSYAEYLTDKTKLCFTEDSERHFGSVMKLGDNVDLGWSSISVMIGTGSSSTTDVVDISNANEILLNAYITKDRQVSFRLAQPDVDDWKGYEIVFTGTGDSSTFYRATLPTGTSYPDLENIYGTRISPESQEVQEVTVKAFSYIARNRGHEAHASFKASKKGGSLYLMDETGGVMDSLNYPEIPAGKSWSYGMEGETPVFGYAEPSPYDFTLGEVYSVRSPDLDTLTEFPPSGFYSDAFLISLPEYTRCEIGGAEPTENSSVVTALTIESTTTVRCGSFVPGAMAGSLVNRTYIFEDAPQVPAVFITADPGSLFDSDSGIYMEGNYAQEAEPHYGANYWLDKEVPVYVELLETGASEPAFGKDAGLSIFGNYSRMNDKKSVAITFREKYGDKRLNYPLFPEFPQLTSFKVFVLRNNGSNCGRDYIRDMLASSITEGLDVDYQRGRASIVYYNGEYYGIHNIRERSTEYYFETHYGLDPDYIDLLKADNTASSGSATEYQSMMDWLELNHLDTEENYQVVAEQIDVDNFINYMLSEIFIDNRDWPGNNLKKWRSSNPKSLWKWFIYDTDFGFGAGMSAYTNNIFEFVTAEDGESWPNGPEYTLLLRRLLENSNFKSAFINRMCALLSMNFESSRVLSRINTLLSAVEPEVSRDQERWDYSSSWMKTQETAIKNFAEERPSVILEEMQEYFELGQVVKVTLSAQGSGSVAVHGLTLDESPMEISFFEGFGVEVSAVSNGGGVFTGWSDGETSVTRIIYPENMTKLEAYFK